MRSEGSLEPSCTLQHEEGGLQGQVYPGLGHVLLLMAPWTVACPVPLSMGILMGNQNNNKKECLRKFSKQKGNNKEKNNLEYQEERNSRVSENMDKVNRSLEFYKLCLTVDEKIITSSDLVLTMCVC